MHWNHWLTRWSEAGLIDSEAAARIRDYENARAGSGRLRWPVLVAIAFGAVMLGGGVLLFVAAHWDTLSPAARFALVLTMVGGFHVAGALVGERVPHLSSALHGVGTVALGAGISLAGQIFNLDEHWPSGILMWAIGAAAAWFLLRQTPQAALLAILMPAWLLGEWIVASGGSPEWSETVIATSGLCFTALTYFTLTDRSAGGWERALRWVGGVAFLPAALMLAITASRTWYRHQPDDSLSITTQTIGWVTAFGAPLLLAAMVRRRAAWPYAAGGIWIAVLLALELAFGSLAQYPWWLLGALGLVAWGVRAGRTERINMGVAVFAGTVVAFYFSHLMDKLGRSASLIGLGLLFLVGGWALERTRRRLVLQAQEPV